MEAEEYLANFQRRVMQDAFTEACADQQLERAAQCDALAVELEAPTERRVRSSGWADVPDWVEPDDMLAERLQWRRTTAVALRERAEHHRAKAAWAARFTERVMNEVWDAVVDDEARGNGGRARRPDAG